MAKELPYFKFEPSRWDNGNIQLCSLEAQGMFINLCCIYWSRIGDLPLKLAEQKLFKSNADAYAELMQEEIFAVNDGKIVINFLDEQLSNFGGLSETKSKAAKVRWDKVRENKQVNADAMHMQSKSNAIREDKIREDDRKEQEKINNILVDFDSIWNLYGKKGNKKTSSEKFNKLKPKERELINKHIPIYLSTIKDRQFLKNLETYLNQRHWETEINGIDVSKIDSDENKKEYVTYTSPAFGREEKDRESFEKMKIAMAGGGYVFTEIKSEWR